MTHEQIKLAFIERAVRDYAIDVIKAMDRKIRQKNVIDTTDLVNSLSFTTGPLAAGSVGKILFKDYGRYIDMGVGKGRSLKLGLENLNEYIENKTGKSKIKPVKIYSPIAYGKLNGLMGDLAHGFTQETINIIKSELENATN